MKLLRKLAWTVLVFTLGYVAAKNNWMEIVREMDLVNRIIELFQ